MRLLFRGAEVDGRRVDVRVDGTTVLGVSGRLDPLAGEDVIVADGGALLPGLHDHHLHLHSLAASRTSVDCSGIVECDAFANALRTAAQEAQPERWLRAVGYHDDIAGALDRTTLDALVPDRPVRVQHRSGAQWSLNTRGLQLVGLDPTGDGRILRADEHMRLAHDQPPDLAEIGRELASYGITGVTDATPGLDARAAGNIVRAVCDGALPQRVHLLGAGLRDDGRPRVTAGPVKVLLPDHELPDIDVLSEAIRDAHDDDRGVAVHCVTREALVLTVIALQQCGAHPDDRIEHGAVVPKEMYGPMAALGVAVVTQPAFIRERGDTYLRDVTPDDIDLLYPYASLRGAGIRVAPSSDAPFGPLDPWQVIATATARTTATGSLVGADERVSVSDALNGYLSGPDDPGGEPRRVEAGAQADLCLLRTPLSRALRAPSRSLVALVIADGQIAYSA
ncbi:MAG: amidohydrolase family protein [Actinomycetes bacterium]